MEKTVICLLYGLVDTQGNLFKTSKERLQEVAGALTSYVSAGTIWLHDGTRPALSTVLGIAPRLQVQLSRKELEDDMEAAESQQEKPGSTRPVRWLPSLECRGAQEPYHADLELARKEIFALLEAGSSVLACTSEKYFRAFFERVSGIPYAGQLSGGSAIILQFVEQEKPAEKSGAATAPEKGKPADKEVEKQPSKKTELVLANSRVIAG
jgi:hypothetical protein